MLKHFQFLKNLLGLTNWISLSSLCYSSNYPIGVFGLSINSFSKHSLLQRFLKLYLPLGGVAKINEPRFYLKCEDLSDFFVELYGLSKSTFFSVVLLWNCWSKILVCWIVEFFSVSSVKLSFFLSTPNWVVLIGFLSLGALTMFSLLS